MTKPLFITLFICLFSSQMKAQETGLKLYVSGAENYPTVLAYDILDQNGTRIKAGFSSLKDARTPVVIPVPLPKRFGVVIYEDVNRNKTLDMGLFGQPTELYAFSNDAWVFLGRPEHKETLVYSKEGWTPLRMTLKSVMDF